MVERRRNARDRPRVSRRISTACTPGWPAFSHRRAEADGRLWFVNGGELQMIDPERAFAPRIAPPIQIQAVTIGGVRRDPAQVLHVPPSAHDLRNRLHRAHVCHAAESSVPLSIGWARYRVAGGRHAAAGVLTRTCVQGPIAFTSSPATATARGLKRAPPSRLNVAPA